MEISGVSEVNFHTSYTLKMTFKREFFTPQNCLDPGLSLNTKNNLFLDELN